MAGYDSCVGVQTPLSPVTFSPAGPRGPDSPLGPARPLGPSGPSSPRDPIMPSSPYNTNAYREYHNDVPPCKE